MKVTIQPLLSSLPKPPDGYVAHCTQADSVLITVGDHRRYGMALSVLFASPEQMPPEAWHAHLGIQAGAPSDSQLVALVLTVPLDTFHVLLEP